MFTAHSGGGPRVVRTGAASGATSGGTGTDSDTGSENLTPPPLCVGSSSLSGMHTTLRFRTRPGGVPFGSGFGGSGSGGFLFLLAAEMFRSTSSKASHPGSSSSSSSSRRRLLAFASRLDGSLSAYRGSSSSSSSPSRRFLGFLSLAPPGCCEDPPPPPPLLIAPSSRLFWCLVAQDCLCAALSALACLRIVLRSSTDFFPATGLGLPPISSQPLVPSSPSSS
mmetsp:Transcript_1762/g.8394  ORF Transcript_1762/g.8394 Transcript_1762/m.8394 type:complete len:223 (+) Transcript_1762:2604-3272(+)